MSEPETEMSIAPLKASAAQNVADLRRARSIAGGSLRFPAGLLMWMLAACGSEPGPFTGFPLFPNDDPGPVSPESVAMAPDPLNPKPLAGSNSPPESAGSLAPAAGSPADGAPQRDAAAPDGPPPAALPPTAFRITQLWLRDPHIFVSLSDVTEQPVLGTSVNRTLIPNELNMDGDKDGFLDLSVILLFEPFDSSVPSAGLTLVHGNCKKTEPRACARNAGSKLTAAWQLENRRSADCLAPEPNTTSGYQPAIVLPRAPCFLSTTGTELLISLGGVDIQVAGARVSATYQTQPGQSLANGLITGFVTSAAAMRAVVPADIGPPLAGNPLSTYIRKQDYDLAQSPTMQDGFWIYLNFVAEPVEYTP